MPGIVNTCNLKNHMSANPRRGVVLLSSEEMEKAMERSLLHRDSVSSVPSDPIGPDLRAIFASLDLDQNALIGKEELRVCLALTGQPVRESTLDMMMALADIDGDGMIDFADFTALMADPKARIQRVTQSDGMKEQIEVFRRSQNTGASGKPRLVELSLEELHAMDPLDRRMRTIEIVHSLLGTDSIRPRDIKTLYKVFMETDTKKMGKLNQFQFEKIFENYEHIDNRRVKSNYVSLLFAFCDSDRSNFIDVKEFIIGLCWLSDFSNIDKLRFAFMLFDLNGNGRMDRDEVIQLVASVKMGGDRRLITDRVNAIFQQISPADWDTYELSFEQLVHVADSNPDLFDSTSSL